MTFSKDLLYQNEFFRISYFSVALMLVLFTAGTSLAQGSRPSHEDADYAAKFVEINSNLTDTNVRGSAFFKVANGKLHVNVKVKGLAPGLRPLVVIHGFQVSDVESATCPTPQSDTNDDGIIDLIETRKTSGFMLIPFNTAPANLRFKGTGYPAANEEGILTYQATIPMKKLEFTIQRKYGIEKLSLEDRVVYIHGAPNDAPLPQSVATIPVLSARMSVPVACGAIKAL